MSTYKATPTDFFAHFIVAVPLILCVFGVGSCKKWQYDECLEVGHTSGYCTAQALGCFSGGKR